MKLKEDLSFAGYFSEKVSGQYLAYLGFPERFGLVVSGLSLKRLIIN